LISLASLGSHLASAQQISNSVAFTQALCSRRLSVAGLLLAGRVRECITPPPHAARPSSCLLRKHCISATFTPSASLRSLHAWSWCNDFPNHSDPVASSPVRTSIGSRVVRTFLPTSQQVQTLVSFDGTSHLCCYLVTPPTRSLLRLCPLRQTPSRLHALVRDAAKASVPKLFSCPGAPARSPLGFPSARGLSTAFKTYNTVGSRLLRRKPCAARLPAPAQSEILPLLTPEVAKGRRRTLRAPPGLRPRA
jgi:hypothetical protein